MFGRHLLLSLVAKFSTELCAAQAQIASSPNGVRVSCFGHVADLNFCLKVVNHVEFPAEFAELTHPSVADEAELREGMAKGFPGEVREDVENHGNLKGNTSHSSWHKSRIMFDNHCLPRSKVGGGDSAHRMLHAGETLATQLFLFRDGDGVAVVPNSGFVISYQSSLYCNGQLVANASSASDLQVSNSSCYAIVNIRKQVANITIKDQMASAGSGDVCNAMWKVAAPPPGSFTWNITDLTPAEINPKVNATGISILV